MRIYTRAGGQASRPAPDIPSAKHRDNFARAAVFEEFRCRDARAVDHEGFQDRCPNESPRPAPESWRWETRRAA